MMQGSQPEFQKTSYDTLGGEKKVQAPTIGPDGQPQAPPPEQEKTFFQKYWMYILVGYLVLTTLGKVGEEGQPQGGSGGGGGRPAP